MANVTEERNFILDYVKVHIMSDDLEEELLQCSKIVFMIKGVQVCETAWLSSHGIAARRFSNIIKEYTEKEVQVYEHGNRRRKRNSQKTSQCLAWINFLANSIGDHQLDSGLIHLPSCFTKLSLYKQMCQKLDEDVTVSQSQFYNILDKQLPNVVTPKACINV